MQKEEKTFRFIYMTGGEAPSAAPSDEPEVAPDLGDAAPRDNERFAQVSADVINLPAREIRGSAYNIRWGNTGREILLNDCLTAEFDQDNPLMTNEGAEDMIQVLKTVLGFNQEGTEQSADLNLGITEFDLDQMLAAVIAKNDLRNGSGSLTPEQQSYFDEYLQTLQYLRDVPEVIEETRGELVDFDRTLNQGYQLYSQVRQNFMSMSNGSKNVMYGGLAVVGLGVLFSNNQHAVRFRQGLGYGALGVGAVAFLGTMVEATTGKSGIEWMKEANRRCGESLSGYFDMPYETQDDRTRMNDVAAIIGGEHDELFGANVSFADLFEAWDNQNIESVTRRGVFSGSTGARRLRDALNVIFEKFGPDGQNTLYVDERTRAVFDYATDPEVDVTPQEAVTDLILSDPDAPRRLMPTITNIAGGVVDDLVYDAQDAADGSMDGNIGNPDEVQSDSNGATVEPVDDGNSWIDNRVNDFVDAINGGVDGNTDDSDPPSVDSTGRTID